MTGLPSCSAAGVAGVFLGGTTPGLTPQKSKNWSAGFDFKPVDGVKLSATYYEMDLKGTIGRPVTGAAALSSGAVVATATLSFRLEVR